MMTPFDPMPATLLQTGEEFCYECSGDRKCSYCGGQRQCEFEGRIVECYCGRTGACIVCNGRGVLSIGADEATGNPSERRKLALTVVGNFRELGFTAAACEQTLASVKEKRSPPNKFEVLRFLRAGKPVTEAPQHSHDFFSGRSIAERALIVTNSVYAWPLALAHYVEHHNIALPKAFELHMANHLWQIPKEIDVSRLAIYPRKENDDS
jgi:hypothetical protein